MPDRELREAAVRVAAVRELVIAAPLKRAVSMPAEALRIREPILRLRLRGP